MGCRRGESLYGSGLRTATIRTSARREVLVSDSGDDAQVGHARSETILYVSGTRQISHSPRHQHGLSFVATATWPAYRRDTMSKDSTGLPQSASPDDRGHCLLA